MLLEIFCVRDRATNQFGTPMFLISKGQAVRSFTDEVNRSAGDNQIFAHPEDFDLYFCGVFDTTKGLFNVDMPEMVVAGNSVKVR